jgi:hypothetical protein
LAMKCLKRVLKIKLIYKTYNNRIKADGHLQRPYRPRLNEINLSAARRLCGGVMCHINESWQYSVAQKSC